MLPVSCSKLFIVALALCVSEVLLQDTGSVENCGDASSSKFTLTWSPKRVAIGGTVTLDGALDAATSLDDQGDNVCVTVWLPDVPDPILPRQCSSFTCSIMHSFVDFLPCPIKAGEHFTKQTTLTVDPSIPFPTGTFIAKAEVFNANNTMFLCARAQVEIYSP